MNLFKKRLGFGDVLLDLEKQIEEALLQEVFCELLDKHENLEVSHSSICEEGKLVKFFLFGFNNDPKKTDIQLDFINHKYIIETHDYTKEHSATDETLLSMFCVLGQKMRAVTLKKHTFAGF
jgi:hypothetical protein